MSRTLLAVDDSVTMRKVLEITFSGEDFRVLTAENGQSALARLGENPAVCVVDTMLGGEDGYALAKEIRRRAPGATIIMLASRYSPFDQARGRDAGADDWADKPFDTQQLIDKVRKVMLAREAGGAAAPPPAPAAAAPVPHVGGAPPTPQAPYRAPAPPQPAPMGVPHAPPHAQPMAAAPQAVAPSLGRGTQPSLGGAVPRSGTLVYGTDNNPSAVPRPAPVAPAPAPPPPPMAQQAIMNPQASIASAVNGQLAGKLGGMGLSPQQADAILALSREVVERVVWEVVPQVAEALIKEEIARLMKE